MADEAFRVTELTLQGYKCSHILVQIGLDALEKSNPDLLRAMSGLANGMSDGLTCGALTGGCCLIGLCAGMDGEDHDEHGRLPLMLQEYVGWFREEFGKHHGGIDCEKIMQDDPQLRNQRCPALIVAAVQKASETLEASGFELDGKGGGEQS